MIRETPRLDINACLAAHTKGVTLDLLGTTALSFMVRRGCLDGAKLLVQHKASVSRHRVETASPLFCAALPQESKTNMCEVLTWLIGARVDIKVACPPHLSVCLSISFSLCLSLSE